MISPSHSRRVLLVLAFLCITPVAMADVFPNSSIPEGSSSGSNRYNGKKNAVYLVIRDINDPALTQTRIDTIRDSETATRKFFAENSGGSTDIYYDHILDVPLTLNSSGQRPSNYRTLADNYIQTNYGINANSYYANVYDVYATTKDTGQTWAGLFYGGNSRDLAIQTNIATGWGQRVIDHELGHRYSVGHASSWRATGNTYAWDETNSEYVPYSSSSSTPYNATPFGVYKDTYGNPFDVMGNISGGDFSVRDKVSDLGWLTSAQVPDLAQMPDLNTNGNATYRIYAHDELDFTTNGSGDYGVTETYASDKLYGLTFTRQAERLDTSGSITGDFNLYTQRIDIEYRSERDGVQFYLDRQILDLDPEGGTSRSNKERELELGSAIEDIAFGMSMYFVDKTSGPDFLSYDPVAPTPAAALRPEWYHFDVANLGTDSFGSFADIAVTIINPLNGIMGDLDQLGTIDQADLDLFIAGWLTDTSRMIPTDKYLNGDINLDGITDLADAFLMHEALLTVGLGSAFGFSVPEPSTALLLLLGIVSCLGTRWHRK